MSGQYLLLVNKGLGYIPMLFLCIVSLNKGLGIILSVKDATYYCFQTDTLLYSFTPNVSIVEREVPLYTILL